MTFPPVLCNRRKAKITSRFVTHASWKVSLLQLFTAWSTSWAFFNLFSSSPRQHLTPQPPRPLSEAKSTSLSCTIPSAALLKTADIKLVAAGCTKPMAPGLDCFGLQRLLWQGLRKGATESARLCAPSQRGLKRRKGEEKASNQDGKAVWERLSSSSCCRRFPLGWTTFPRVPQGRALSGAAAGYAEPSAFPLPPDFPTSMQLEHLPIRCHTSPEKRSPLEPGLVIPAVRSHFRTR